MNVTITNIRRRQAVDAIADAAARVPRVGSLHRRPAGRGPARQRPFQARVPAPRPSLTSQLRCVLGCLADLAPLVVSVLLLGSSPCRRSLRFGRVISALVLARRWSCWSSTRKRTKPVRLQTKARPMAASARRRRRPCRARRRRGSWYSALPGRRSAVAAQDVPQRRRPGRCSSERGQRQQRGDDEEQAGVFRGSPEAWPSLSAPRRCRRPRSCGCCRSSARWPGRRPPRPRPGR